MNRLLDIVLSETSLLVVGATLINLALVYGLGVSWGWWGWSFWCGIGVCVGALRS